VKEDLFWKHKLCERKLSRSTGGYVLLPNLAKNNQHRAGTHALVFPSALLWKTLADETIVLIAAASLALLPLFP